MKCWNQLLYREEQCDNEISSPESHELPFTGCVQEFIIFLKKNEFLY